MSIAGAVERDGATPMFGYPVAPWHRKFAFVPVDTFDEGWKWLCFVERRRIQKHWYLGGGDLQWWQYRASVVSSHQGKTP